MRPPSPSGKPAPAARDEARVLARGLEVLKLFAPRNAPLSNGQIADAVGLPRPTVSRITATLLGAGYLEYLNDSARYRLGASSLTLGFACLASVDILARARAPMQAFANQTGVLVALAARDDMAMVCHTVCRGPGMLTIRVGVGSRLALPYSAMGRAWIASLPDDTRATIEAEVRQRYPAQRDELADAIDAALSEIATHQFCVTYSSLEPDVNSIGTVIRFADAPGQYTLGCSAPAFHFPPERCFNELGPRLLALRDEIERDLASFAPETEPHA